MTWSGTAQAHMDAGKSFLLFELLWVQPTSYATGATVPFGAWTGEEPITLVIDGELRGYEPVGTAMSLGTTTSSSDGLVQSYGPQMSGLHKVIDWLRRDFDMMLAPVDAHLAVFTPGLQLLGLRKEWEGIADGDLFEISDVMGQYGFDVVDATRRGTRKTSGLKDEQRDPAFRHVSEEEGDTWR